MALDHGFSPSGMSYAPVTRASARGLHTYHPRPPQPSRKSARGAATTWEYLFHLAGSPPNRLFHHSHFRLDPPPLARPSLCQARITSAPPQEQDFVTTSPTRCCSHTHLLDQCQKTCCACFSARATVVFAGLSPGVLLVLLFLYPLVPRLYGSIFHDA